MRCLALALLLEEAVDGLIEAEQLLRSLGWAERGNKLQAIIARAIHSGTRAGSNPAGANPRKIGWLAGGSDADRVLEAAMNQLLAVVVIFLIALVVAAAVMIAVEMWGKDEH